MVWNRRVTCFKDALLLWGCRLIAWTDEEVDYFNYVRWLQLRFDFGSMRFDSRATVNRPRSEHSTTYRRKYARFLSSRWLVSNSILWNAVTFTRMKPRKAFYSSVIVTSVKVVMLSPMSYLSVCLSANRIKFLCNFMEWLDMIQGPID